MSSVTCFSPAKLNLFLRIVGKRDDSYHLLQSVFCLIDLYDEIGLTLRRDGKILRTSEIECIPEEVDLSLRAAKLLQNYTSHIRGVEITLRKNIPIGSGLGGGSSNAATVLMHLNQLWNLNLSRPQLIELGLMLGADVPFFLFGNSAWVEGIGEVLEAIPLEKTHFILLIPEVFISTKQIFSQFQLTDMQKLTKICPSSLNGAVEKLVILGNDLESVVFQSYPLVKFCWDLLNRYGTARMSGSGSAVFLGFSVRKEMESVFVEISHAVSGADVKCLMVDSV